MKIRIEVNDDFRDEEIIIRCRTIGEEVRKIQLALEEVFEAKRQITFYQGEREYYFPLDEILFLETEGTHIYAHTVRDVYQVKYKLYELENMLPTYFMRVSKSTILNVHHIYSITRNITAASTVGFQSTHKQVYVSRHYYKALKIKLEEKGR